MFPGSAGILPALARVPPASRSVSRKYLSKIRPDDTDNVERFKLRCNLEDF
jgi:hypothetical protein